MLGIRIWDNNEGWGTIILETDEYFIIKWDRDLFAYSQISKGGIKNND